MIIFSVISCWWYRNSDWPPQRSRLLLRSFLFVSIWIWGILIWPVRPLRTLWELNSLFLSVCWTVWSPSYTLSSVSDLSYNIDSLSKSTSLRVKVLFVSGSQSLKPLTLLVNPMKIHFLDLNSSLFLFWLSTKLYVGQPKSVRLNRPQILLAISPPRSENQ